MWAHNKRLFQIKKGTWLITRDEREKGQKKSKEARPDSEFQLQLVKKCAWPRNRFIAKACRSFFLLSMVVIIGKATVRLEPRWPPFFFRRMNCQGAKGYHKCRAPRPTFEQCECVKCVRVGVPVRDAMVVCGDEIALSWDIGAGVMCIYDVHTQIAIASDIYPKTTHFSSRAGWARDETDTPLLGVIHRLARTGSLIQIRGGSSQRPCLGDQTGLRGMPRGGAGAGAGAGAGGSQVLVLFSLKEGDVFLWLRGYQA